MTGPHKSIICVHTRVIKFKVKVSKRYKNRTTDQNNVRYERNIIKDGEKRTA